MKNDYLISYYDSMPIITNDGQYIEVFDSAGWYVQISEFEPWGPFQTQKEAIESLLIEWPRFEDDFWKKDKQEDNN